MNLALPSTVRPALRRSLLSALGLAVLALAIGEIIHVGKDIHLSAAMAALGGLRPVSLALALGLTVASYLLLTFYDLLAQRLVGISVPLAVTMRASFTSYALSHTLGFGALTGGSARLRIYGAAGVPTATVARIVVIAGVAFWLGVGMASGIAMFGMRTPLTLAGLTITPATAHVAGAAVLAAVISLAVIAAYRPGRMTALVDAAVLPRAETILALAIVSTVDLACASLALYLLLPHEGWHFARFMLAYALGITLGLVTHVPGGVGVFEAVIIATLPDGGTGMVDGALGGLLAYRIIYYLLPFALAVLLNGAIETSRFVPPMARLAHGLIEPGRRVALAISPPLFGLMTFAGGLVLLLSGAAPAEHARLHDLIRLLPLPFIETSHLAASLVGTGLLLVAPALAARLASGMRVARGLFFLGAMFSLAKGLDFEEALVMLTMAGLLQLAAPAFYRGRTGAFSTHNLPWLIAAVMAVVVAGGIGALFYNTAHFRSDLWWHFALYGDGPRALRAGFAASVLVCAFAVREWMTRPRAIGGEQALPPAVAQAAMASHPRSDSALAFTGDKRFLVGSHGDCFVMFRPQGRTWVVMGDPVGPRERWGELVWDLRRLADLSNALLCFYQASEAMLPLLVELGLLTMKYGEEAIVDPTAFTLQGPRMKGLRNSRARAMRDGVTLQIVPQTEVPRWLPRLQPISDGWLARHKAQEKGFSLGGFDAQYMTRFDLAVVLRDQEPVAFANLWLSGDGEEMSVDLMRQTADAPPGTMDFLFTSLIELARARGCHRFNLGLAPLSGVPGGRLAPFWAQLARAVYRVGGWMGGAAYNFAGLRFYKQKFAPQWQSRYLACPHGPAGFVAVGAVIALVSGGRG